MVPSFVVFVFARTEVLAGAKARRATLPQVRHWKGEVSDEQGSLGRKASAPLRWSWKEMADVEEKDTISEAVAEEEQ